MRESTTSSALNAVAIAEVLLYHADLTRFPYSPRLKLLFKCDPKSISAILQGCRHHAPEVMDTIPILDDILDDQAPYPYTLSAFVAYLSDNHCLEILQFIFETRRYRRSYNARPLDHAQKSVLHRQWLRLLQTHIVTGAPREINITNTVRDSLLSSVSGPNGEAHGTGSGDDEEELLCPDPEYLEPAEKQMHELLDDSILQRFVKSCSEPEHMQPSVISDTERGTRSYTSDLFTDDTDDESRRRAAAEICHFPSPDPSDEEAKGVPLQYRRSRSWSWSMSHSDSRHPFKPRPLSQPSSRTKLHLPVSSTSSASPPQPRTIKLDDSPPRITFNNGRPNMPSRRKHGSMSSNATGTRSLSTSPEEFKDTTELVRTNTSPANTPDEAEQLPQRQGQKRRWHRLPTTGGFLRHFKKVSNP